MPITTSAKKALRSSKKKRVFNQARKKAANDVVKQFKKLVDGKNAKEAKALLPQLQKALDKGSKAGTWKKGAADRRKSRFAAMIKKIS